MLTAQFEHKKTRPSKGRGTGMVNNNNNQQQIFFYLFIYIYYIYFFYTPYVYICYYDLKALYPIDSKNAGSVNTIAVGIASVNIIKEDIIISE